MIPGPRPPKGHGRPIAGRDRSRALRPARPHPLGEVTAAAAAPADVSPCPDQPLLVALTRTPKGWAVVSPAGLDGVRDRLAAVGGSLEAGTDGEDWVVTAHVPVRPEGASS